jgi:hypothetical protein
VRLGGCENYPGNSITTEAAVPQIREFFAENLTAASVLSGRRILHDEKRIPGPCVEVVLSTFGPKGLPRVGTRPAINQMRPVGMFSPGRGLPG